MMSQQGGDISFSNPAFKESKPTSTISENTDLQENNDNREETVVWPWMVVVANIPLQYKDTGKELKDEWIKQGYNPTKVHHLSDLGFSVVEFGKEWYGFGYALMFVKDIEVNKHGRNDWYDNKMCKDDKLYAWIAKDEDYNCNGVVGDYLRKNGNLKTVSEKQRENEEKNSEILLGLKRMLEEKKKTSEEVQTASYMKQKEMMIENLNREYQMMEEEANEQLKIEHEESKLQLEEREKILRLCEAINKSEQKRLDNEKKMKELAILEQKKADERMLKLADEQKREKEELHEKMMELEKKVDDKQKLELEINKMKGEMEVMKHMTDEDVEAKKKKLESMKEVVKEKEGQLELAILEQKKAFDSMLKLADYQKVLKE